MDRQQQVTYEQVCYKIQDAQQRAVKANPTNAQEYMKAIKDRRAWTMVKEGLDALYERGLS